MRESSNTDLKGALCGPRMVEIHREADSVRQFGVSKAMRTATCSLYLYGAKEAQERGNRDV
jgi:hypothetical protein